MEGILPLAASKSLNTWVSVYELLRGRIIAGTYCPGEKLNEREIAQLGNVSRTPTREALRVLEYEGFVTNISKKGVFVKKYSPDVSEIPSLPIKRGLLSARFTNPLK